MSVSRVAARYAKPIIELAIENKLLEALKADMEMFSVLCNESREFSLMLKSPIIAHLKKAEVLNAIFSGKVNPFTLRVFETIVRKNREVLLHDIAKEIIQLYNQQKGIQEFTVTTTYELSEGERKIFEDLSQSLTGKKPVLHEEVKSSIIGGFQLKFGDRQLDQSVSGKLNSIKTKFIK